MIAHCFCHPHTLVHCTSLVGLRVSYTSAGGELILHKTGRHNQVDRQAWREGVCVKGWDSGELAQRWRARFFYVVFFRVNQTLRRSNKEYDEN